jgi:hypothetical protein
MVEGRVSPGSQSCQHYPGTTATRPRYAARSASARCEYRPCFVTARRYARFLLGLRPPCLDHREADRVYLTSRDTGKASDSGFSRRHCAARIGSVRRTHVRLSPGSGAGGECSNLAKHVAVESEQHIGELFLQRACPAGGATPRWTG